MRWIDTVVFLKASIPDQCFEICNVLRGKKKGTNLTDLELLAKQQTITIAKFYYREAWCHYNWNEIGNIDCGDPET